MNDVAKTLVRPQGTFAAWLGLRAVWAVLVLVVLLRFGLFAAVSTFLATMILNGYPVTANLSAWYAGSAVFALAIFIGSLFYGFYVSLAGRPLFKDILAE